MITELKKDIINARNEIIKISEIDSAIAKKLGISISYLNKIRSLTDERPKRETKENIELLEKIKKEYKEWTQRI